MASTYDASSIKTMSPVSHIRAFPSMYIPSPSSPRGQSHIIKEVIDNSFDEAENDPSKHHFVKVILFTNNDETVYQIAVIDNGRGVPIEALTRTFSEPRTSGKWGDAYEDSTGIFGVGAKATAILSSKFVALAKRDNKIGIVDMEKGEVVNEGFVADPTLDKETGTIVFFEPDPSIFANTDKFVTGAGWRDAQVVIKHITAYTANTNTSIYLVKGLRPKVFFKSDISDIWKYFTSVSEASAKTSVLFEGKMMNPRDYVQQVFGLPQGNLFADITVTCPKTAKSRLSYDITLLFMDVIKNNMGGLVSMVNKTMISGSSASQNLGLQSVLKSLIAPYIEDEDIRSYFEASYTVPVYGSLNVKWKKAIFTGQTKDNFEDNVFYFEYTADLSKRLLENDSVSRFWFNVYDHYKDHIETSYHDFINKGLKGGKIKNIGNGLNKWSSYMGCLSTDKTKTELLIVEGDSAGGAIDSVRNSTYQAVFLLKGKPINPEKHPLSEVLKDPVFQDLVRVIGVAPGDKDLEKLNFNKIGILTDADEDGKHIASIALAILKTMSPKILNEGSHVFMSSPPLYFLRMKKEAGRTSPASMLFVRDYHSLVGVKIDKIYYNSFDLTLQYNNGPLVTLSAEEFKLFCFEMVRVCDIIKNVASVLAINPEILEMLIHCISYLTPKTMNAEKIREILKLDRVEYRAFENTLVLSQGVVDTPVPLTNLLFDLRTYVLPELAKLHWHNLTVYMTTKNSDVMNMQPVSFMYIYRVMKELDSVIFINRFKGLGQTPEHILEVTCINPDTRCIMPLHGMGDVDTFYRLLGTDSADRKLLTEA